MLVELITAVMIISGALVVIIGLLGLYRMPDFFTRLHAASVIDTLGVMLVLVGLMVYAGIGLVSIKLLMILVFILITTPTAAHALAKSALHDKVQPVIDNPKQ